MIQITSGYSFGMSGGRPAKQPRTPFGERMAHAREKAGLTQQQLADKLGITQPVIAYWEREPVALRADQLATLADVLDVSADSLLGRDNAKPSSSKAPSGKLRQVFEKAHQLPRHQQNKIVEFVETYINTYQRAG